MERIDILEGMEEIVRSMHDYDIVAVHNDYCQRNNYMDDYIYNMEEFDDLFYGLSPLEVAEKIYGEDFNPNDSYFIETIYGVESFDDPEDHAWIVEIAEYCYDHDEDFGMDEIRDYLDEIAEELEEDTEI